MKIYNNILETIGNTPLVRLNKITKDVEATVLAKVETTNPGNSVKDRMAVKMVEDAEKAGLLKPGGTIIEGTSGNTGMGLALVAIIKGYKLICVLSDKQSKEKMARGLDIPELSYIIHFELPHANEEFTHRNGRTARVSAKGTAYVIKEENKSLPEFIQNATPLNQLNKAGITTSFFTTLFISGGRKDKISKGDIAGVFMKKGGLSAQELGVIELKQDCAFVAVPKKKSEDLIELLNNTYFKKKKVRIYEI